MATGYLSRELQVSKKEWDAIDEHEHFTSEQQRRKRLQLFGLLKSSLKKSFTGRQKVAGKSGSSVSKEDEANAALERQENGMEKTTEPGFFRCFSLLSAFYY